MGKLNDNTIKSQQNKYSHKKIKNLQLNHEKMKRELINEYSFYLDSANQLNTYKWIYSFNKNAFQ